MSNQSDFKDKILKEQIKILSDEDNEIKKWNEGLLLKSLIILPIIIFIIGLFLVNRPANLTDVLLVLLYPLTLVSLGLILLFAMRINLK